MGDIGGQVSTVSAAVAALAALATLVFAFLTFREGRKTIGELQKLAREAAKETAAQEAIVASMQSLVQASNVTAKVLHSVFLEAQAAREVEALLRIRAAVAEVAYGTQRIFEGQPSIVLYGARQQLLAALAGVPDPKASLPDSYKMGQSRDARQAQQHELAAISEVEKALDEAREKLAAANSQSNDAMDAAW
jgi:hypothetical protein